MICTHTHTNTAPFFKSLSTPAPSPMAPHEEEEVAGEEEEEAPTQLSDTYLLGFILANIVGLRYYTGRISGREMVALVREPLNPYDPNAIKVLNTRSTQVGHIERHVAAALSPLLDSRLATLEGIVPKPPKPNPFKLPVQLHVFARPEAFDLVQSAISAAGLHLISDSDPLFPLSESLAVRDLHADRGGGRFRTLDDVFALVHKGGSTGEIEPLDPPKDVIATELFPHQKEGLGWLVGREDSDDLPPFWELRDGGYVNVLTNYATGERPRPLRGGIFADDMGLGKTLTLLSLIAFARPRPAAEEEEEDDGNSGGSIRRKRRKTGGRRNVAAKRRRTANSSGTADSKSRTTLVVCPPSVFATWITQLEEHTRPGSLKVYIYHGERTREVSELAKYDIVLTTYSTLSSEYSWEDSPLKVVEWLRVILDEAHLIKNFAAMQTKACIELKAERRWVVTGTPIHNNSFDLFSLMAFLRFEPFSIKSYWQSLVQRPLDQGKKSGMSRLQALVGTISLRRTKNGSGEDKSLVGLPPKTVETCFVDLSAEEREQYDQLEAEAQCTVRDYIDSDTVMRNYSTVLHIILRLRQICNDVALCPTDFKSLLPSTTLEDITQNPELLRKLIEMIQDGDDFDCPICLSPPSKTVITVCAHIFCQTCILRIFKQPNARCPMCRHPLAKSDLFVAPPQTSEDDKRNVHSDRPLSSKVSMLLKLLLEVKEQKPSVKSVVFSQFRKMLILMEEPLRAAGFIVMRLDGLMSMKKRADVIREFSKSSPAAPTVLLASLRSAGAGVNLTAASRVYLVEPWWNPAVEEQAMDRVHRIGQQEEVKVVRLIARSSIEERVLQLQERKKKLASGAFGKKRGKEQREMRVADIRSIMRL